MSRVSATDEEIYELAEKAADDRSLLQELLAGLSSQQKSIEIRDRSYRTLRLISETHPEAIYSYWGTFAALLKCDNAFSQYPAIYVIANLASIDSEHRFEAVADDYFGLMDRGPVSVAAHTALNAAKIARAKPELREYIVGKLISIEAPGLEQERRDLVKAYAVESLDALFASSGRKKDIIDFVASLRSSSSPKARKAADRFLRKHRA